MESFIKKNELGIKCEYYILARYKKDSEYIIYTDFVTDDKDDLRLFVGKKNESKIEDVELDLEKAIINEFKITEKLFLETIKGRLYE